MKVSIYNEEGGGQSVLVEAALGKGRPPVLVRGINSSNIRAKVGPVIREMGRPKGAPEGGSS